MVENWKKPQHENKTYFFEEYANICYIAMLETVMCNILWAVPPSAQLVFDQSPLYSRKGRRAL